MWFVWITVSLNQWIEKTLLLGNVEIVSVRALWWQATLCKSQQKWILWQFVTLHLWVTVTVLWAIQQYRRCPELGSCDDGMQGEWGTSREEHGVDWSPRTQSDPAERVDSPSHTPPLLSAHKYTAIMLWLALKWCLHFQPLIHAYQLLISLL